MATLIDFKERKDKGYEASLELDPPPLHKDGNAIKIKKKKIQFGVQNRTAMGEYKKDSNLHPLSHLAIPGPGPLDYDPKLPPSGFQYSILGKHQGPELIEDGPGPNQYNIDKNKLVFDSVPQWTFGKKIISKAEEPTPSPLTYNIKSTFGKDSLSCTVSGRHDTKRKSVAHIEILTPGPERYFPPSEFGKSPKYSFGLKTFTSTEVSPGPLDYKVPSVLPDAPKGPAFTMRHKYDDVFYKGNGVPGPDVYYPKLDKAEKSVSLKGMSKEPKIVLTPGPANYIIPSSVNGPKCTMTPRNIPYQDEQYIGPNPGPADYNPTIKLTVDSVPKFSLGSRLKERPSDNHFVPGPCAYEPKDRQIKYNQAPHVMLKGLPILYPKREKMPGPADYGLHLNSELTPAELNRNTLKLSTAERLKNVIEDSPGPADYQVSTNMTKKKGPCYSLRKRLDKNKVDQSPGPNAYNPTTQKEGGKISMKSRASPFVLVFPSSRIDTIRVLS
ncbi:hypothetical protein HDV06_003903 [Boothiomyces sp. JEL0866]|nr:hypothetical protein HDV06_003903 [Boothiomyces sp. JEL0866]